MAITAELARALLYAGLPIFIFSFGMMYWALKRGYLNETMLTQNIRKPEDKALKTNFMHKKWFQYGGGFYGLMTFFTYLIIESREIYEFVLQYPSWLAMLEQISIRAIIKLLIDSVLNLVTAFIWFIYWPKQIAMNSILIWLVTAYLSYRLGTFGARWQFAKH